LTPASEWTHVTVLRDEAVEALAVKPDGCYVDATYGRGGHARALLAQLGPRARLHVLDKDPQAVAHARAWAQDDARIEVHHVGFAQLANWPAASVDGLLMDLGVSSPQLDDAARGFSFRHDGPLDMRMDNSQGESVAQWLLRAQVSDITRVLREYGEERFAASIARAIDRHRQSHGAFSRTGELAALVARQVKSREPGKDPATRTFQALRIHINGELDELQHALQASLKILKPGGRLVVIGFHSLEDRMVKRFMQQHARETVDRRAPVTLPRAMPLKLCGRVMPSAAARTQNPRARSAVMRVAERTEAAA
jgi:16S rRNA (cytosine1402-N4)-methyltransferase